MDELTKRNMFALRDAIKAERERIDSLKEDVEQLKTQNAQLIQTVNQLNAMVMSFAQRLGNVR